ncbi:DNA-3-methyladenine glycosylase II [hydrothermal vent metagenome]|uniref:DNA-3-methyladenine glycosylase II n=1 Tax=hydrothermal vent metagenome TaxID=652676 RepID=A0A3B0VG62_9ZZZZ
MEIKRIIKTVKIKQPANFSFNRCLEFLNRGYAECLYMVSEHAVKRMIRLTSGFALIEVSADMQYLLIRIDKAEITHSDTKECYDYVIDWFDLDRDISGFYQLLEKYAETENFPKKYYGLRLIGIVDLFEALCWCVIGQQINLNFAHKIKTRLVHKYGNKILAGDQAYYAFPAPQALLNATPEELALMQFSRQKINYIHNIATVFCANELNKSSLLTLSKTEQMDQMLAIKGVGPWTANYVSMKSLRNMNCITYGDTGLSSALHKHFNTAKKPDDNTINKIFRPFAGWESYLNFYLWRSLG